MTKTNEFQYPPIVITGKEVAVQGMPALMNWLTTLSRLDREFIEPYLAVLRDIAKEKDGKVKRR